MSITKSSDRQQAIVAYADVGLEDLVGPFITASTTVNLADLTSGDDFTTALALPVGAVVVSGTVNVDVAFDSATSDTLTVGDASTGDRYLAGADLQDLAPKPLVPTGFIGTSGEAALTVNWTGVSTAPTVGRFSITLQYYVVADVITETANVLYSDLTSGVAFAVPGLALPAGAVVIGGSIAINTAFDSVTSDVIVVGDVTTANRYVASTDIHTGATTPIAFVPTGFVCTATQSNIKVTWTEVGGSTSAGVLAITVHYYIAKDAVAIELPNQAQIISGGLTVLEAFDSGTSDTASVGDAASPARYKSLTSIASAGRLALVPTGYDPDANDEVTVRWLRLGATAPTTGKLRLDVKYLRNGRAHLSQD
jgi:hypothetical protein